MDGVGIGRYQGLPAWEHIDIHISVWDESVEGRGLAERFDGTVRSGEKRSRGLLPRVSEQILD